MGDYILYIVLICFIGFLLRRRKESRLPLPPGPKKLPIVGNLFQIPTSYEWEVYTKWCKDLNSDIIHLDAAGTSVIILDSIKAANELLEKRSAIYSSRARSVMVHDLVRWDVLFGFMPYNEEWKKHRKLFQQHLHPGNIKLYQPYELVYSHRLLRHLLDSPDRFRDHIRFYAGATTISLAYGLDIQDTDDPYLKIAEEAALGIAALLAPGAFLVDSIPLLKYVPSWMPGASFKRKAKKWNFSARNLIETPFKACQSAIAEGTAKPSYVSLCLADLDETSGIDHLQVIQGTAGSVFVGGSDSTISILSAFLFAMIHYPDIQRKAHEEVDRVLTKGQLPTFEDEASLPYIAALVKEITRWHVVAPLGLPHYLIDDDEYNGYFIPKGSHIVANVWAMLHNEEDFPEPFEFKPERFLQDGKLDPNVRDPTAAFGFGRRVCPGKHIGLSIIWITVASMLTVYEISPEKDGDGNPIMPTKEFTSSLIVHPPPFKCNIKPRSREAEQLILSLDESM